MNCRLVVMFAVSAALFCACPNRASAALTVCNQTSVKVGIIIAVAAPYDPATRDTTGDVDVRGPLVVEAGKCTQVVSGNLNTCGFSCPSEIGGGPFYDTGYSYIATQDSGATPAALIWTGAVQNVPDTYCADLSGNWFEYRHQKFRTHQDTCPGGGTFVHMRSLAPALPEGVVTNDFTLILTARNADGSNRPAST